MRAKEYIYSHLDKLQYGPVLLEQLEKMKPLRNDWGATSAYVDTNLSADVHLKKYETQTACYEKGGAMQPNKPMPVVYANEVPGDTVSGVRKEMLEAIASDASFGYLYYILGTEYNSNHSQNPIDCTPVISKIKEGIKRCRDSYPQDSLQGYLDDNLNYEFYNTLKHHEGVSSDEEILEIFNQTYQMFDALRLAKDNILKVRSLLDNASFPTGSVKRAACLFMEKIIKEDEPADEKTGRLLKELERQTAVDNGTPGAAVQTASPVYLCSDRGVKINIIRVLNALYELGFFVGAGGRKLTKKDFFVTMGKACNVDLSNYDKDLSRSTSDSTTLEKHLVVFENLKSKMIEIFNSK